MVRMLLGVTVCFAVTPLFAADPPKPPEPIVLHVEITADADGELQALLFEGKQIAEPADKKRTRFDELTDLVRREIEAVANPDRFEIVIEADKNVRHAIASKALLAVAYYRSTTDGKTHSLAASLRVKTSEDKPIDDRLKINLPKPKYSP
jgi:hypothetical protein